MDTQKTIGGMTVQELRKAKTLAQGTWEAQLPDLLLQISKAKSVKIDVLNKFLDGIPIKYRKIQILAMLGRLSPIKAIRQTCRECVGFEDVSERISTCRSYSCPIHSLRPYQDTV